MSDEEDKKPAIEEKTGETASVRTEEETGQHNDDAASSERIHTPFYDTMDTDDENVLLSEDSEQNNTAFSDERITIADEETLPQEDALNQQASLLKQAEQIKQDVQNATNEAQDLNINVTGGEAHASQILADTDLLAYLEYLWMIWADFSISITSPLIEPISPPIVIPPLVNEEGKKERVFCINDEGFRLSTSRGEEAYSLGQSMFKYFNTIEKMIKLLVERLKTGGIDKETEVRVAFFGFELGQRKAFESILNLEENVVVTNYDPGEWGDRYMKNILELAERGYGLPPSSPRTKF